MASGEPFYNRGLRFSCERCSACCRHEPGFVFLTQSDLSALAGFLNMEPGVFIGVYCRWIPAGGPAYDDRGGGFSAGGGREELSLREKSNYDCIFWDKGCTVYEKRPVQCRTFPFWESIVHSLETWRGAMTACPGMGKGRLRGRTEIENKLVQRSSEPVITRVV